MRSNKPIYKVLLVEDNITTGNTLQRILMILNEHNPSHTSVFADYIIDLSKHTSYNNTNKVVKILENNFHNCYIAKEVPIIKTIEEIENIKINLIQRLQRI